MNEEGTGGTCDGIKDNISILINNNYVYELIHRTDWSTIDR